jgi:hypothetical protein
MIQSISVAQGLDQIRAYIEQLETDGKKVDWQSLSERDCCDTLYQIGGALRRMGKLDLAMQAEKVAGELYPGKIKPAPIVPRTTT